MSEKDGGPAFPVIEGHEIMGDGVYRREYWPEGGMSLRDYFAITLLAGDASCPGEGCDGYMAQRARVAYAYADAMLAERAK